jgi:hypothetical protein
MKNTHLLLMTAILSGLFSCREDIQKLHTQRTITEWIGKQIQLSNNYRCGFLGRDTTHDLCAEILSKEYKVLLYLDSTGCTPCKLRLSEWKKLMYEADSLFAGKLGFIFVFYPKDKRELYFLLKRDQMDYPVFVDTGNIIYQLNKFPEQSSFQCFLLDRNDKVISIGNPTTNFKVWELYKKIITGEISDKPPVTTVEPVQSETKLKDLQIGKISEATFTLKNIGTHPLIIQRVESSCGCTVPNWEKQPVAAGKNTEITVKITPEEKGYFNKTVTVYCNTEEGRILLKVSGMVE